RDVDERDRGGQDALAAEDFSQLTQARVGQVDDADVRLNRGERIVRGEHRVLGQGVEEGGLAYVRESDDCDSESHDPQGYLARLKRLVSSSRTGPAPFPASPHARRGNEN